MSRGCPPGAAPPWLPPLPRDPGRTSFDSVCHGCAGDRQHCQHLGSQDARPGARAEATPGGRATSCRPLPREDRPPPEALFRALAVHRSPEPAALKPEPQGSRGRPGVRKAPSTARPRPRSSGRALLSEKKGRSGALPRGLRAYHWQYAARPATRTPVRGLPAELLARLGPGRSRCSELADLHASAPTTSRWRKC